LFGLRSSWALNREIKLDLKVDNLLDKATAGRITAMTAASMAIARKVESGCLG
jgi:outer membrane receptor for monomeric catechols